MSQCCLLCIAVHLRKDDGSSPQHAVQVAFQQKLIGFAPSLKLPGRRTQQGFAIEATPAGEILAMPEPQQPCSPNHSAQRPRKQAWTLEYPPDDILRMSWQQRPADAPAEPAASAGAAADVDVSIFQMTFDVLPGQQGCCNGASASEAAATKAAAAAVRFLNRAAADAEAAAAAADAPDAAGRGGAAADGAAAAADNEQAQDADCAADEADGEPAREVDAAVEPDAGFEQEDEGFVQCCAVNEDQAGDDTGFCMMDDDGGEERYLLEGLSWLGTAAIILMVILAHGLYIWRAVRVSTQGLPCSAPNKTGFDMTPASILT